MSYHKKQFKKVQKKFQETRKLVFSSVLKEEKIQEVLSKNHVTYKRNIFTPMITLWAFLSEVLNIEESYRKVAAKVKAFLFSQGIRDKKVYKSTYCEAKKRLKEKVLFDLVKEVGEEIREVVPEKYLWCGRKVKTYDGSSLIMADTEKNRAEFPQWVKCKPDCGFPLARFEVVFCLSTGVVLDMGLAPMEVSEQVLYRRFFASFEKGDVALADRGGCSYYDMALLKEREADGVFRMNASRKIDFRKGTKLGKKDHIVIWKKGYFNKRVKALSREEYDRLPKEIQVREVEVVIKIKGFRPYKMIIATTLLDAEIYTKESLAELYLRRWEAELNLRHLKTTMKMERLKSKSPAMVRKEVLANLLAYNLIRSVMWEAGIKHGSPPLRISFKGTLDHINAFLPHLQAASTMKKKKILLNFLLETIAKDVLPKRENRIYKRCVKQRKKAYPVMTESRSDYRARKLEENTCG